MPGADDTNELPLPSLEALVAGTLALMTTWADPVPDCRLGLVQQRSLLARKVVSNLFFLQHHPHASPALRQVTANAHGRWLSVAAAAQEAAPVLEPHHAPAGACPTQSAPAGACPTQSAPAGASSSQTAREGAGSSQSVPAGHAAHLH